MPIECVYFSGTVNSKSNQQVPFTAEQIKLLFYKHNSKNIQMHIYVECMVEKMVVAFEQNDCSPWKLIQQDISEILIHNI